MRFKNTKDTYGLMSKSFHWIMALLILGLIVVGFYMKGVEPPQKYEIYGLHKAFGLLVLWLVGLRLVWRTLNVKPEPNAHHQRWERVLAGLAHLFLYIAMIAMPLTGWLMSSAGGYPVSFFGLEMPALMDKNPDFGRIMNQTHSILGYILSFTIILHALGALKHHFIDKDASLTRMIAGFMHRIGPYFIILLLLLFGLAVFKFAVLDRIQPEQEVVAIVTP